MSHAESSGDSTNPISMAIAITVGTLMLVVGIILLAKYAVGTHSVGKDTKASTPTAIAERIAPVAKLAVEGGPAVTASVSAPPAAPAPVVAALSATPAGKVDGKSTYDSACMACHAAGVAGAPKVGDKQAWGVRINAGNAALYAAAIKGKGAMPAKGGNTALSDDAVKAAVDYMLAQSK